jgi:hypothetical protein
MPLHNSHHFPGNTTVTIQPLCPLDGLNIGSHAKTATTASQPTTKMHALAACALPITPLDFARRARKILFTITMQHKVIAVHALVLAHSFDSTGIRRVGYLFRMALQRCIEPREHSGCQQGREEDGNEAIQYLVELFELAVRRGHRIGDLGGGG